MSVILCSISSRKKKEEEKAMIWTLGEERYVVHKMKILDKN